MAFKDFTDKENLALEEISRIDEWEFSTLAGLVKHELYNGRSFKNSVMTVLARAKRPVEIDPKRAELLKKVQTLRDQLLLNYNNDLELKKAGILK
jgi:hypothetical protein